MEFQITDQFLIATLAKPERKNAFSLTDARELAKHFKNKKYKGFILRSQGSVFCAGGDLSEYAKLSTKAQGVKINKEITKTLSELDQWEIPKLVVVDGDCFGGGVELISCFDWIVSTPKSLFALWQRKMEVSFGWGGYHRLLRRASESQLKSWLLSAEIKTAFWMETQGFVDHLIHDSNIEVFIEHWKQQQIQMSEKSFKAINQLTIKNERKIFDQLWWSPEHQEKLKISKR